MMGFRDMKLYGTLYDGVSLKSKIGLDIEFFDILEVYQRIRKLDKKEIHKIIERIKKRYTFAGTIKDEFLIKPAELFLAIKEKVEEEKYDAISLSDVDGVKKHLKFAPALTMTLLADELGICTIPETDALGSVTQIITKYLTNQTSAYMEFYEFMEDRVLIGVPDYVPSAIVKGSPKLMLNSFGDFDKSILNVSEIKTGKITLARLTSYGAGYSMHLVLGNAVKPDRWTEIGWDSNPQLPSLEVILDTPVRDFAKKVMSQHYIISFGDNTEILKDFCNMRNITVIV
jgi:L-fucose isomerase-like protein